MKISVIVPVYNLRGFLERCINSLLAQTCGALEIIAVDDGSTDGSGAILDRLAQANPGRLRVIHKENGGVTSARLRGVREAAGEWIGFVDGDDETEPDMYQRLLENGQRHNADISHCGCRMVFADGRESLFYDTGVLEVHARLQGLRELLSGARIEPGLCNKLYRRQLFDGWHMDTRIRINEDLLMNYYLFSAAASSVYEDRCYYRYMVREGSASRGGLNPARIQDPIRVRARILEEAPEPLKPDARRAYLSTCIQVYNSIALEPPRSLEQERVYVRRLILESWSWTGLLSRKQRLLARMIRYTPGLYRPVYRVYAGHIQKNPYI